MVTTRFRLLSLLTAAVVIVGACSTTPAGSVGASGAAPTVAASGAAPSGAAISAPASTKRIILGMENGRW